MSRHVRECLDIILGFTPIHGVSGADHGRIAKKSSETFHMNIISTVYRANWSGAVLQVVNRCLDNVETFQILSRHGTRIQTNSWGLGHCIVVVSIKNHRKHFLGASIIICDADGPEKVQKWQIEFPDIV